jgi:hypothetical protein
MSHVRWTLFAGVMGMAFCVGLAGCGTPKPAPEGAPKGKQADPEIQLGNDSGAPTDTKGAPTDSSGAQETPKDEKGDK